MFQTLTFPSTGIRHHASHDRTDGPRSVLARLTLLIRNILICHSAKSDEVKSILEQLDEDAIKHNLSPPRMLKSLANGTCEINGVVDRRIQNALHFLNASRFMDVVSTIRETYLPQK